jgi:hypothetical protein
VIIFKLKKAGNARGSAPIFLVYCLKVAFIKELCGRKHCCGVKFIAEQQGRFLMDERCE